MSETRVIIKNDNSAQVSTAAKKLMAQVVEKAARDMEGWAAIYCEQMGAIDTGNLLNSIGAEPVDATKLRWRIFASAEYAGYVNYGTVRMPPRPFFTSAIDKVKPTFLKAMKRVTGS